jgi:lysyl-tRNA synthetase class 2
LHVHVESAAIRAIDYDPPQRRLLVTFASGELYEYDDVPRRVHRAFVEAESKGRFFQSEIRGRYDYRKLS